MNPIRAFYRSDVRTGLKILLTSLVLGTLSAAPLWLVLHLGPKDASPVGLGLLAMFGTLLGAFGAGVGLLWWIIELIFRRR